MRVIQLPEGSRTSTLTVTVDGERISASFNKKGQARVSNAKAEKLCKAIDSLTLVGDEEPDETEEEVE